jgi:hypothetical protein
MEGNELMDQATPKRPRNSDRHPNNLAVPKRKVGAQSPKAKEEYETALDNWCEAIIKMSEERGEQDDNFAVSSRGWCYLLEPHGLLKGDFDTAQRLINDCRKSGRLPLDICCEDERRSADNLESLDDADPVEEAERVLAYANDCEQSYYPHSFWEAQEYYVELMVEKVDVKNLFRSVTAPFRIPIANGSGWADLNARAAMMRRFKQWERRSKQCVLLYCGDLDPGGLRISNAIRKNLADMSPSAGWKPDRLIIDRFGIDADFVKRNRVPWIDNLHTSKKGGLPLDDPDHADHDKDYVQDYIAKYGSRKVEATALVEPRLVPPAREMCRKAILKYLPASAPVQYRSSLELPRQKLRFEIRRLLKAGGR